MRALALMMAYELPFVLSILSVMIYYNTTSLATIVNSQQHSNIALITLPLSMIAADIALQGQFGKKPFDQTIAPHEIATGPMVEYGGKYLGMLLLWHSVALVMEAALFIDLFLAGGVFFFGGFDAMILNIVIWAILIFAVILVALFIDAVMPRWRIDQAFIFYWTWPTLIAIIGLAYALGVSA
jgi:NADH-quinone oxidoreductase subunit H